MQGDHRPAGCHFQVFICPFPGFFRFFKGRFPGFFRVFHFIFISFKKHLTEKKLSHFVENLDFQVFSDQKVSFPGFPRFFGLKSGISRVVVTLKWYQLIDIMDSYTNSIPPRILNSMLYQSWSIYNISSINLRTIPTSN